MFRTKPPPSMISGILPKHRASCEIENKCILAHANRLWYRPAQRYAGWKTTRKFRGRGILGIRASGGIHLGTSIVWRGNRRIGSR